MNAQLPHTIDPDTPVEIHGYKTDPLRRGYQVLWNYESIYWRALVGNDAWGVYEVLRNFCHDSHKTCYPSINLLMAILGIQDRRLLTGRIKTVKGKTYRYPGLIELLQEHDLCVAEVAGDGPTLRYTFHVNLTPGLLTEQQLQRLPGILQTKHAELLARCEQAKQALVQKKKPAKVQEHLAPTSQPKGYGKFPEGGVGNSQTGSGNFPPKHYQENTTQATTTSTPPNGTPAQHTDVVVALKNVGIGSQVASTLSRLHPPKRILEKLDYLDFLQETNPRKVGNPRGWLRKAIEEDYGPPDGYQPYTQRQAEADAKRQQQTAQDAAIAEQERSWSSPTWRTWVVQAYNVPEELQQKTNQLVAFYRQRLKSSVFLTWVNHILITEQSDEDVHVAVPIQQAQTWLTHQLTPTLEEAFYELLQRRVNVIVEVIERTQNKTSAAS